ncbi:hypothetical protein SAM23877_0407 [Streptomyces ambofaciens ATCC 23877]|uniref:Uncharacterized protein n=1 Tax=Streptomyces ambofaciens (strain ATCC 23877 / 3486 / DSM 40053 / JCM 4204 / NBRC 12836 / NRRL B-2516) TaxID=278992 RepID=A0A0K2AKL1_STRA7|nr:hypothetical protein SAM23877_0407 [Streptomyces ambofaciens ATCC 23877]
MNAVYRPAAGGHRPSAADDPGLRQGNGNTDGNGNGDVRGVILGYSPGVPRPRAGCRPRP